VLLLLKLQGYDNWTWSGWCGYPYHDNFTWIVRLLRIGIGVAISIILFYVFPKIRMLELLGLASLAVYLFHGLAVDCIHKLVSLGLMPYGFKTAIIYSIIITVACYLFSKTRLSKYIINPISSILHK